MTGFALLAALALAAPPSPQVTIDTRASVIGTSPKVRAELRELEEGHYNKSVVSARGLLLPQEDLQSWVLSEAGGRVLVIPLPEHVADVRALTGRRVHVIGYVRELVEDQGTCLWAGRVAPASVCDNPDLPPTPNLRPDGPRVSITIWSAVDITESLAPTPAGTVAEALEREPRGTITVRGRFCGRALCGDAKSGAPSKDAWLVAEGDAALWVVGRRPRGDGWRLDPDDAGDTRRWVEVTGKLEQCAGAPCLKARKVALVPAPAPPSTEP